jgi:MerR family transcriptional regulator/heat shock protein HspR
VRVEAATSLARVGVDAGGQRRYSRAEITQVQRVAGMSGEGMTLAGIRRILDLDSEIVLLNAQLARERRSRRPKL